MRYLDDVGLTYLWGKITALFVKKAEIPQYVICTLSEYEALESYSSNTYYIIVA